MRKQSLTNGLPPEAACLRCGYLLRGLSGTCCPECGGIFDPADPSTFAPHVKSPTFYRWSKPPPFLHFVGIIALTSATLYTRSFPNGRILYWLLDNCLAFMVGAVLILLIVADYGLRLLAISRWSEVLSRGEETTRPASRMPWLVTPVCLVLLVSAIADPWPLRLRFQLSMSALDQTVRDVHVGKVPTLPAWIGLYRIHEINEFDSGAVFFKLVKDPFRRFGFHYHPQAFAASKPNTVLSPFWFVPREQW